MNLKFSNKYNMSGEKLKRPLDFITPWILSSTNDNVRNLIYRIELLDKIYNNLNKIRRPRISDLSLKASTPDDHQTIECDFRGKCDANISG